jgi:hypothetical protein
MMENRRSMLRGDQYVWAQHFKRRPNRTGKQVMPAKTLWAEKFPFNRSAAIGHYLLVIVLKCAP